MNRKNFFNRLRIAVKFHKCKQISAKNERQLNKLTTKYDIPVKENDLQTGRKVL